MPRETLTREDNSELAFVDEDDDGLGYYDDGVKRTLTDEQIAIFRHSEMEALKRGQRFQGGTELAVNTAEEGEDGEIVEDAAASAETAGLKKKKKKKKKGSNRNGEEKPDLRKRTWDVVEAGLDSLDYDEMERAEVAPADTTQRRRISYDD